MSVLYTNSNKNAKTVHFSIAIWTCIFCGRCLQQFLVYSIIVLN